MKTEEKIIYKFEDYYEIWSFINDYYVHKSGSNLWPSDDPEDSEYDTFTCKKCGEELKIQMYGISRIDEPSFEEKAMKILLEHLFNTKAEIVIENKGLQDMSASSCNFPDEDDDLDNEINWYGHI